MLKYCLKYLYRSGFMTFLYIFIYCFICCYEDVCDPLTIDNGEMEIHDRIDAGHVAKIQCDPYYKLNQSAETVCQSTGTWSNIPTCRPLN